MNNDTKTAYRLLTEQNYTCVLCRGDVLYCSRERGVRPLLQYIDESVDVKGFSAADKVVGNAAAFLYVLMEVEEVRAGVVSRAGLETLTRHRIHCIYDVVAETIHNRTGTGSCPMEEVVQGADTAQEACQRIRKKLAWLQQNG